jgi:hypothetical protein
VATLCANENAPAAGISCFVHLTHNLRNRARANPRDLLQLEQLDPDAADAAGE